MRKIWASIQKEILLLRRDMGGLAILFVMPLVLIITITLIQDSSFKSIKTSEIPIILVNHDDGFVSEIISENITESQNSFKLLQLNSEEEAKEKVFSGNYKLAIVIPQNLSEALQQKVDENVSGILSKFGIEEDSTSISTKEILHQEIRLYFDPATQQAFKISVRNAIDKMVSEIETETIYNTFKQELGEDDELIFETESLISFKEIVPMKDNEEFIPNSAQHNVPAWTLFAIFFIIVPLSINMVKEKNLGTFVRLRTHPINYSTILAGKTAVYLGVCLIQFLLMLLIGVYLFPVIGLPTLEIFGRVPLLFTVAFFAGLAAVGLGLLLGTLAKTQEQAAPFGATAVVILAALGGVWVPVFVMPSFMQVLAKLSPMNWALNAFYDVFLRNSGLTQVLPEITLLFLFFAVTSIISIVYNERKNTV